MALQTDSLTQDRGFDSVCRVLGKEALKLFEWICVTYVHTYTYENVLEIKWAY
jgi:hypothetical protein